MSRESSRLGAVDAGGADDEAHALGRVELEHDVAQTAADRLVFDLPRDADPAQGGHEHQVAAGNADVGGERRALGADAFLDHLHQHLVAAAEDLLDGRLEARPAAEAVACRGRGRRPASLSSNSSPSAVVAVAARARGADAGRCGIVAALAEVLRLDVADVQEAVAAHAEIDEGGLDARLQVDHHALVDVSYVIVLSGPFDVQLFEHSVFNDRDAAFFRLRDVDQHFLFHVLAFSFGNADEHARGGKQGSALRRSERTHGCRPPRRCGAGATPCRFQIGQAQGRQHVARAGAASAVRPAAASRSTPWSRASTPAASGADRPAVGRLARWIGQDGGGQRRSIRSAKAGAAGRGNGAS